MASASGRVGSAQLLRHVTAHRTVQENQKKEIIRDQPKEFLPEEKDEKEHEIFCLLTPESVEQKKLAIKEREKKLEERKDRGIRKPLESEGKLVDGKVIYENESDENDDLDEFGVSDPTIEDGNELPERFGKINTELLYKPLIELGI